jgi:hypothetical protein
MMELICKDVYRLFSSNAKGNERELFDKTYELGGYFAKHYVDSNSIKCLINLERKIIHSRGRHKKFIEEKIFGIILERVCLSVIDNNTASLLLDFIKEVFDFKIPRDNFNNKRKSLSLEILIHLSNQHEIPDMFELCLSLLKSKKNDLILAAIKFHESYCRKYETTLDEQTIKILDKIVLQTKNRAVAISTLNVQVVTGHISEFEAISRIDTWKEENCY